MSRKIFTKEIILDQAYALAKDCGLYKLRMRKLATALNASVTPIYESFVSKEDLIEVLFQKIIKENLSAGTYFKRNEDTLLYGLRYPLLYNDIRKWSPRSPFFEEFYSEILVLMQKEPLLTGFDLSALKSLNFDLTIYINGLVDTRRNDSLSPQLSDQEYVDTLRAASELLILGYRVALTKGY